jgi:hypothetical protein
MLNVGYIVFFFIQNYITSVLWSDQNEIVVYRGFLDFKKMHVSRPKELHCRLQQLFIGCQSHIFLNLYVSWSPLLNRNK